jgi:hypothetical protein
MPVGGDWTDIRVLGGIRPVWTADQRRWKPRSENSSTIDNEFWFSGAHAGPSPDQLPTPGPIARLVTSAMPCLSRA